MKLARFVLPDGRPGWGRVTEDETGVDEPTGSLSQQRLEDVLYGAAGKLSAEMEAGRFVRHDLTEVQLLSPIGRPPKLIGVGRNYREHASELDHDAPIAPMLFGILPSAVVGPHDNIELPSESHEVDWEGELGVVIGRRARRVPRSDAMSCIAGYVVINDISARDLQRRDGQWTRAKSFDTFKPTGPWLVTVDALGLAASLRISVRVNGATRQDANTAQMIFPVAFLVEYISAFATLMPGDIIATGTPGGVGAAANPPSFLQEGDVVQTEIEGIGSLVNRVISVGEQPSSFAGKSARG